MTKYNKIKKIIILCVISVLAIVALTVLSSNDKSLDFQVKMNKNQAILNGKSLAGKTGFNVKNSMTAANFQIDSDAQTYYELEVGSYKKLNSLIIKEQGYIPATWTVSIIPQNKNEKMDIYYTPSGRIYGFYLKIPDTVKGESLTESEAMNIAEKDAVEKWNFNKDEYNMINTSQKNQSNGRIDYVFTYERNVKIGSAKDEVELQVDGNKLVKVQHKLDIPDEYLRRYEERRSNNDTIANASIITFYVLIFIVGFFCLFYLSKRKLILWKKPLIFSITIVALTLLSGIPNLKSSLTSVDTTFISPIVFYVITFLSLILEGIFTGAFTFAAMLIGEGISRKAFPEHPQVWKMFSTRNIGSWRFLFSVILAYTFVCLMLLYETIFYKTVGSLPGWWQPASMNMDPNIQTNWLAWVQGFTQALNAGFFEEFGFRAIPISLGVLIGSKYNKKKLGVVLGFIFEIVMFSAGHANYPGFPAYARLLELLIPAFGFGLMFYFLGIIPGIIAHFTYDFILMNMSIMTTPGNALIYQKILVIVIAAFPLLISVYGRIKNGKWIEIEHDIYNGANSGIDINNSTTDIQSAEEMKEKTAVLNEVNYSDEANRNFFTKRIRIVIYSIGVAAIIISVIGLLKISTLIPSFKTDRKEAERLAVSAIEDRGFKKPKDWKVISDVDLSNEAAAASDLTANETSLSSIMGVFTSEDFIKNEGISSYKKLIGSYINPIKWKVRFVKINGDVNSRAEEYDVTVIDNNHPINVTHIIPNNKAGENLTKEQAMSILSEAIKGAYGIDKEQLSEVSASQIKLDSRTDWSFTLEDKTVKLKVYKPYIKARVSGNEVLQMYKTLELPEEKQKETLKKTLVYAGIGIILCMPFVIAVIAVGIKAIIAWTKKQISKPVFFKMFAIMLAAELLILILDDASRQMGFSTAMPYNVQVTTGYALGIFKAIVVSFLIASIIANAKCFSEKINDKNKFGYIIVSAAVSIIIFALNLILQLKPLTGADTSVICTLSSRSKLLSLIAHTSISYIEGLAVLVGIISLIKKTNNKILRLIFALVLMFSLGFSSSMGLNSISAFIVGIIGGLIYILLYYKMFRYNFASAAVLIGVSHILSSIKAIVLNQYPALNVSIILSIIVLACITIFSYSLFSGELRIES